MKKLAFAALFLAGTILISSCSSPLPHTAPTASQQTETTAPLTLPQETAQTAETVDLPKITANVTRADLEKIPVANASMTEDQLRDIVVQYMLLEKSVMWTVNKSLTYPCDYAGAADAQGNLHINAGTLYRGIPYIPAHLSLEAFLDLIDEENGVIDTSNLSGLSISSIMGNTCNTSVYWAWARVTSAFPYVRISRMTEQNHCIPIGPYEAAKGDEMTGDQETNDICAKNGEQVMFQSYACLKKADGLFNKRDGSTGHVIMARENAVVVRNPDGTINGDQSYVICMEQASSLYDVDTPDGPAKAYSGDNLKLTFSRLFKSAYLPCTIPEFCGMATVQVAKAWLAGFDENEGYSSFAKSYVTANYEVTRVDLTVSDATGKVLAESFVQNNLNNSRKVDLTRLLQYRDVRQSMRNGETYHITVTARLSNGETKIAYEGDLVCKK